MPEAFIVDAVRTPVDAKRAARWQNDTTVDYKMAYSYAFEGKKG